MNRSTSCVALPMLALGSLLAGCSRDRAPDTSSQPGDVALASSGALNDEGKTIFRFDTFGDETFWTDSLKMHEVIRTSVSPKTALKVGLKVDADALPASVRTGIQNGTVPLDSPSTTVALLKLGAVVGVVGQVDAGGTLTRVGITCALCHSTVDNSFSEGIGSRMDAWPNRDLDVGAIIALSRALTADQKKVYNSWGPGKYDPRYNIDGKNMPVVIPSAFGLKNVKKVLYTGDDTISYWNAYVAITQMHGHGRFVDPRIGVDKNNPPDKVTAKLPALRAYQFSIDKPKQLTGLDESAAQRGETVFQARCARCHVGEVFTDVNEGKLHTPAEVGQSAAYAERTVTKKYRTTPLRGLWHPPQLKGPYFHDGNAATLEEAVAHYDRLFDLQLSAQQKSDLVAYLKTL